MSLAGSLWTFKKFTRLLKWISSHENFLYGLVPLSYSEKIDFALFVDITAALRGPTALVISINDSDESIATNGYLLILDSVPWTDPEDVYEVHVQLPIFPPTSNAVSAVWIVRDTTCSYKSHSLDKTTSILRDL